MIFKTPKRFKVVGRLVLNFIRALKSQDFLGNFLEFIKLFGFKQLLDANQRFDSTWKDVIIQTRIENDLKFLREVFLFYRLYSDGSKISKMNSSIVQKLKTIFLIFLNHSSCESAEVNLLPNLCLKLSYLIKRLETVYNKNGITENELFKEGLIVDKKVEEYLKCKILKVVLKARLDLYDYLLYFYYQFLSNKTKFPVNRETKNKTIEMNSRSDVLPLLNIKWEQIDFKPVNKKLAKKRHLVGAKINVTSRKITYEYVINRSKVEVRPITSNTEPGKSMRQSLSCLNDKTKSNILTKTDIEKKLLNKSDKQKLSKSISKNNLISNYKKRSKKIKCMNREFIEKNYFISKIWKNKKNQT